MKLLVDGIVYDSTKTPILIHFDENEQEIFNVKKFVSGPPEMTEKERSRLIRKNLIPYPHVVFKDVRRKPLYEDM